MSLVDRLLGLFGKERPVDANVAETRSRQRDLHGVGLRQTPDEEAGTRANMEAELDRQRAQRSKPPTV